LTFRYTIEGYNLFGDSLMALHNLPGATVED
jgi:hypothetical protein